MPRLPGIPSPTRCGLPATKNVLCGQIYRQTSYFFVTLLSEFRLRLSQQSQSFEKNSYPTLDALIDAVEKSQLK